MADNSLEELAKSLVGTDAQKLALENNPYASIAGVLDQVTPLATRMYQQQPYAQRSSGELLGSALATGLLGGLAENKAQDYQGVLLDRYAKSIADQLGGGTGEVEGLPTSLFNRSKQLSGLFALQQKQAQQQREQALADKIFSKQLDNAAQFELQKELRSMDAEQKAGEIERQAFMTDPLSAQQGIEAYKRYKLGGRGGSEVVAEEMPVVSAEGETLLSKAGLQPLQERRKKLYDEYRQMGFKPNEATSAAKEDIGRLTEGEKGASEDIAKARNEAQTLSELADIVDQTVGSGLKTGKLDQWLEWGSTKQELLQSIAPKVLAISKPPASGAMSDLESKQYLAGGPTIDKSEETNLEIASRMRQIAERKKDYAEFADTIREQGGTLSQANALWSKYERANPLWIKDEKTGSVRANPNIMPYADFDFSGKTTAKKMSSEDLQGGILKALKSGATLEDLTPEQRSYLQKQYKIGE